MSGRPGPGPSDSRTTPSCRCQSLSASSSLVLIKAVIKDVMRLINVVHVIRDLQAPPLRDARDARVRKSAGLQRKASKGC